MLVPTKKKKTIHTLESLQLGLEPRKVLDKHRNVKSKIE